MSRKNQAVRLIFALATALFLAPPALAAEAMEAAPRVAQVAAENPSAPAESLGDNRQATLGDINRLDAKIEQQGRELRAAMDDNRQATLGDINRLDAKIEQQGRELRAAMDSHFRWTLALIVALLGLPQLPGWIRAFRGAPSAP